jgi:hypothetical protein
MPARMIRSDGADFVMADFFQLNKFTVEDSL